MRKLFTILMMTVLSLSALAQTETTRTIHGAVVDKNGNPLPGAVVNATGGAETTMTDADGTFEMEVPIWLNKVTASYGGFGNKTLKTNFDGDMIFRLSPPKTGGYFINAVGGASVNVEEVECFGYFGIKGGHLANWGWYAEIGYDMGPELPQVILGGIRRLAKNNFIYLGLGYGGCYDISYGFEKYSGMAFDLGYMAMIGQHVSLSIGATATTDFYINSAWGFQVVPKLSVGYVF